MRLNDSELSCNFCSNCVWPTRDSIPIQPFVISSPLFSRCVTGQGPLHSAVRSRSQQSQASLCMLVCFHMRPVSHMFSREDVSQTGLAGRGMSRNCSIGGPIHVFRAVRLAVPQLRTHKFESESRRDKKFGQIRVTSGGERDCRNEQCPAVRPLFIFFS